MLAEEVVAVVCFGAKACKVRVARLTRIRSLPVVMARGACGHGGEILMRCQLDLFESRMASFACNLLLIDMQIMWEEDFALRRCQGDILRRVVACMAEGAVATQLFFVARLAALFLAQKIIGRELAHLRLLMTIRAGRSDFNDVELV